MIRYLVLGLMAASLMACEIVDGVVVATGSNGGSGFGAPNGSPGGPPEEVPDLPPEEVLDIPTGEFTAIPSQALIDGSRDSCTSPCPVYFDAIADLSWNEIEGSKFTWAFSDGSTHDGFMAARVFELPEGVSEQTFETTLVVERNGVAIAKDSHPVTVRAPRGRTICVAQSNFSGCPSSSSADHFTDVRAAWNAIETDGRILFRRGDSFSSGVNFSSTVAGPVHVGAFGSSSQPRPAILQSGGMWKIKSQWSVTDLDISGGGMGNTLIGMEGVHTLLLRSHIHDAASSFTASGPGYDGWTHKFLIDNQMTNMHATNYIGGSYIAIVGNYIERWESGRHTIRVAGGKYVLVANNSLISDVGHSSLTVRGSHSGNRPGSDYVLVQDNLMMQWASVHPQNASSNEWLRHVIWERNVHVPYDGDSSNQTGLSVNGDDMVIRNNIFHQIRRAITIETHPLAGSSSNIHVYQNTQYVNQDLGSTHYFCDAGSGTTGTVVRNNLAVLHGNSPYFASVEGGALVQNNYSYTPNSSSDCKRPDGSSTCADPRLVNTTDRNNASFMLPQTGSPAIDTAMLVPASYDFYGTPRPQGNGPDVGAVERM